MLARRHKSWKRHFAVRMRKAHFLQGLRDVASQLLADAHSRGQCGTFTLSLHWHTCLLKWSLLTPLCDRAHCSSFSETVQVSISLRHNFDREPYLRSIVVLPHAIR